MIETLKQLLLAYHLTETLAFFVSYAIVITLILIVSLIANFLFKRYIVLLVNGFTAKLNSHFSKAAEQYKLFVHLASLAPALIIYASIPTLTLEKVPFTTTVVNIIHVLLAIYMVCIVTAFLSSLLNVIEDMYDSLEVARQRPIKSYLQVIKIFLYFIAVILVISILLNKSPLAFLAGLGAMMAVLMLVFKDSIMGLVASVQNASYDIIHIGDWIEIPQYGVNGDVIEMSLNTIKVQNFDKTIVTIPSSAILTSGVKNWRGMEESGGRRIKRSIHVDMRSIKFCTKAMVDKFKQIKYITEYIDAKEKEINEYNKALGIANEVNELALINGRHLTNIGTFRAYIYAYLRNHPKIHQGLTLLVRHLQPNEKGLPIELYIFTNDTNWNNYEGIQADIFDHILAVMPEFELKVFQNFSGSDINGKFNLPEMDKDNGKNTV